MTRTVTIRMSEDLHKRLKLKMVRDGKTIREYIISLVEKDMKPKSKHIVIKR